MEAASLFGLRMSPLARGSGSWGALLHSDWGSSWQYVFFSWPPWLNVTGGGWAYEGQQVARGKCGASNFPAKLWNILGNWRSDAEHFTQSKLPPRGRLRRSGREKEIIKAEGNSSVLRGPWEVMEKVISRALPVSITRALVKYFKDESERYLGLLLRFSVSLKGDLC